MAAGQGMRDYNVDPGAAVSTETLTFYVSSALTATTNATMIRVNLPYPFRIRRSFINAQTVSGTSPTLSAVWKQSSNTLVTSSNATTANTGVKDKVDVKASANADLTCDLLIGGSATPTFQNITIQLGIEKCDPRDVSPSALDNVTW